MDRLLKEYGDAIQREIRFCLLDQRLRRVVGESDVFQSVMTQFALKLREGQYNFDTPSELVGLLKTIARTHAAHLARFWHARRRDLRKNAGIDAEGVIEPAAADPTASSVVARVETLELALAKLSERDRQILDWRQDGVVTPLGFPPLREKQVILIRKPEVPPKVPRNRRFWLRSASVGI
jgi:hypothetical protein